MSEKELYFEGSKALINIFAGDPINNIELFEKIFKVRITKRDYRIKIYSDNPVFRENTFCIMKELNQIYESGYTIRQKDLEFILSNDSTKKISNFFSESIKVSPRKDKIIPRTIAYFKYIRSIIEKYIVFVISPVGTRKTYLAMATAISSYLAVNHARITQTRPAMKAGKKLGFLSGHPLKKRSNLYFDPCMMHYTK